ncbi:RnfH family protein [Caldimonas sp. KR1-144]|uniref:RnfH family protein n=1 Tax=Caldimonas sp. KR1-144 TaxID=3400911 RepID=UPI003C0E4DB4
MSRVVGVIVVEVAYSPAAGEIELVRLELAAGSSALQALRASRLMERHPEIDPSVMALGVWGRACAPSAMLCDGDRLEVYRALKVDPKEARRQRYQKQPKEKLSKTQRALRRR